MAITAKKVAETVRAVAVAVVREYRAFVIDRARDDIRHTTRRARRSYRATWEPRHRHRRLGAALPYSIRHDIREAAPWLF